MRGPTSIVIGVNFRCSKIPHIVVPEQGSGSKCSVRVYRIYVIDRRASSERDLILHIQYDAIIEAKVR